MDINTFLRKHFHREISMIYPGRGPITHRYSYQTRWIDFGIKPGDSVLDIGSGQDPFPLATHLADRYEEKTSHRTNTELVRDERPFTPCNIEDMPFQDKQFDFVYATHVLEHVDSPAKACRELMRIARRGYIETPTRTSDIMFNHLYLKDHHKWHINLVNETLIFMEYTDQEKNTNTGCNTFFNDLHSSDFNHFQELFHNNQQLFNNMFLWEDQFYYYVFNKLGRLTDTNVS